MPLAYPSGAPWMCDWVIAVILLCGWLAGCAVLPTDASVPNGEAVTYVVGRGWHTDIGLPMDEVAGPLTSLRRDFPGVRYMVFGFGGRQYYMAHDAGSGEMLGALFPSKSAILVTALRTTPTEAFADQKVVTLHLPRSNAERIAVRLWDDLEKSADGSATRLADGPYAGSAFYASPETYDARYTCNLDCAGIARGRSADEHERPVCGSGHATGGANRGDAGAAGELISRAAGNRWGTRPACPAAR